LPDPVCEIRTARKPSTVATMIIAVAIPAGAEFHR